VIETEMFRLESKKDEEKGTQLLLSPLLFCGGL
jgi:hypothetical protein